MEHGNGCCLVAGKTDVVFFHAAQAQRVTLCTFAGDFSHAFRLTRSADEGLIERDVDSRATMVLGCLDTICSSQSKGRLRESDDLDGNLGASIEHSGFELSVAGFLRFRSTDCLWKEVILALSCRMGSDPLHSVSN
jgi:hypothetical protein